MWNALDWMGHCVGTASCKDGAANVLRVMRGDDSGGLEITPTWYGPTGEDFVVFQDERFIGYVVKVG